MSAKIPSASADIVTAYPAPIPRRMGRRATVIIGAVATVLLGAAFWSLHRTSPVIYITVPVVRTTPFTTMSVPERALMYAPIAEADEAVDPGPSVHVWVLRAGKPVPVPVIMGPQHEDRVEIVTDALKPGDSVIVAERVKNGARGLPD